jgi:uncharacterized protein YdhG (YjbR/CyaY superfamily)
LTRVDELRPPGRPLDPGIHDDGERNGTMSDSANEVDEYLAGLPRESRAALDRLRATIRAAAPDATEAISYRVPTFKHHGGLVGFAGFEGHCSFFVMSPEVMDAHAEELKPYDTAKATIR